MIGPVTIAQGSTVVIGWGLAAAVVLLVATRFADTPSPDYTAADNYSPGLVQDGARQAPDCDFR